MTDINWNEEDINVIRLTNKKFRGLTDKEVIRVRVIEKNLGPRFSIQEATFQGWFDKEHKIVWFCLKESCNCTPCFYNNCGNDTEEIICCYPWTAFEVK